MDMHAGFFMLIRMPTVHVDLAERSYDVIVEAGTLSKAGHLITAAGLKGRRAAVISDETVSALHAETLLAALETEGFHPTLHTVPAGEASKSMIHAESLSREMIRAGHDRKSIVIALGGGVVGDLAGFVAAIFYRGLPFIQIPTTIVAQVDSSVGGKTGVNVAEGKNLLGAFHQPRLVIVDPETLRTLPDREFHEGFAEAIKHAAIRDAAMLDDLAALDPASREVPAELIARNIAIKARVVEADEHETLDIRALLNFGHTIGHGIESFSWESPQRALLHGEAVAIGMLCAAYISWRSGLLPREANDRIAAQLRALYRPFELAQTDAHRIVQLMRNDKKNVGDEFRFTLLTAIGQGRVDVPVSAAQVQEAVEYYRLLVRE
jgi:3-dehydroquinate synthase